MRGGTKTLIAACVALLLAVGMIACGGGGSSDSTSTKADSQGQTENASSGDTTQADDGGRSDAGSKEKASADSPDASDFVPKQHNDSGGGSGSLKVKGADNSVQEFGDEADTSELDAAAAALHNFLDARAARNWAAACEYLSNGVVESFESLASQAKGVGDTSCAALLEKLTNPAATASIKAEAEKADVRSLRIEGENAFLIYIGLDGAVLAISMVNEDGEWKVNSLAGTPLN